MGSAAGQPNHGAALAAASTQGLIDAPIWLHRESAEPLGARIVAVKEPPEAAAAARTKAAREVQRGGHRLSPETLVAADWMILVTSLEAKSFSAADLLALRRLRWRIALAFKRLKSLIGSRGLPGTDERSARPHLLVNLLPEPLVDAFDGSPRLDQAA